MYALTETEKTSILRAADIVALARTGVELDYRGDVIDAHAPEMPTRLAKQLDADHARGAGDPHGACRGARSAIRCARDCIPQLRLAVLRMLALRPTRVLDIRRRLQKPRATVDRAASGAATCWTCSTCERRRRDSPPRTTGHHLALPTRERRCNGPRRGF